MIDTKITIRELPPRARRLAPGQLAAVFGGCSSQGGKCDIDKNCCDGYACTGVSGSAGPREAIRFCQAK
jgi:hypothetical protein